MPKPPILNLPREVAEHVVEIIDGHRLGLPPEDLAMLQSALAATYHHDTQTCVVCVHEVSVGLPPLLKLQYDPELDKMALWVDNGPAQGERATGMLEHQFARDPFAAEIAVRINDALKPLDRSRIGSYIAALVGALVHLTERAEACSAPECSEIGHRHTRKEPRFE